MNLRQTHTYAILAVPAAIFAAVREAIASADPGQAVTRTGDDGELDMNGIALAVDESKAAPSYDALYQHLLNMLGASTHEDAGRIIGQFHAQEIGGGRVHHQDDTYVDVFAGTMKNKLAEARDKGRGGWEDPERCDVHYLAELLLEQLRKPEADPVDVANFAMFLHHRAGGVEALRASIAQAQGYNAQD